jgi:hypothetical protein
VIKKEAEVLKIKNPHNRDSASVEYESKYDTVNNRGDWIRFRITQTMPEQESTRLRNFKKWS